MKAVRGNRAAFFISGIIQSQPKKRKANTAVLALLPFLSVYV